MASSFTVTTFKHKLESNYFYASASLDWLDAWCFLPVRPSVRLLPNLWIRCFPNGCCKMAKNNSRGNGM